MVCFKGNFITGAVLQIFNENWLMVFWILASIYVLGGLFFVIFAKGHVIIEQDQKNYENILQ
jgi:hypothetical protein